jgi:hypothetical protein
VSRQQALIRRDLRGAWWLENVGKGTVYVNGIVVNRLASCELSRSVNSCVCVLMCACGGWLVLLCNTRDAPFETPGFRVNPGHRHRRQADFAQWLRSCGV